MHQTNSSCVHSRRKGGALKRCLLWLSSRRPSRNGTDDELCAPVLLVHFVKRPLAATSRSETTSCIFISLFTFQ